MNMSKNRKLYRCTNPSHLSLNANATVTWERREENTGSFVGVHLRERFNHTIIIPTEEMKEKGREIMSDEIKERL